MIFTAHINEGVAESRPAPLQIDLQEIKISDASGPFLSLDHDTQKKLQHVRQGQFKCSKKLCKKQQTTPVTARLQTGGVMTILAIIRMLQSQIY